MAMLGLKIAKLGHNRAKLGHNMAKIAFNVNKLGPKMANLEHITVNWGSPMTNLGPQKWPCWVPACVF